MSTPRYTNAKNMPKPASKTEQPETDELELKRKRKRGESKK